MRRLAIVLVQAGLFFGVTGACSADEDDGPKPRRIMPIPGGSGGSTDGGSSAGMPHQGGTGGSVTPVGGAGAGGDPAAGGVAGNGSDVGGAGGSSDVGGAGGAPAGGAPASGGAGGGSDVGGAGGSSDVGGASGSGSALGGAGGQPAIGASGAAGAGGSTSLSCLASQTFTVVNNTTTSWTILGQDDPELTLCRGNTYVFDVTAPGHSFYIKTAPGSTAANAYNTGVTGNGTLDVTFVVPAGAPDTLYYNCGVHAAMGGTLTIVN